METNSQKGMDSLRKISSNPTTMFLPPAKHVSKITIKGQAALDKYQENAVKHKNDGTSKDSEPVKSTARSKAS